MYSTCKDQALNDGRDRLSDEELEFVGLGVSRRGDTSDGWISPIGVDVRGFGSGIDCGPFGCL